MATEVDPSTARLGESLYQFFGRAIPAGYSEVWEIETERLKSAGHTKPWELFLYNKLFLFNAGHVIYMGVIFLIFGLLPTLFHLAYSIVVTLMLETINYIEHYGLLRKKLPGGVYEPVKITHSWNAPQLVTNYIMFKLQRPSDHHANSYKPYQILESFSESPMLPYGYTVSLLLSLVPPVWKKVTDPISIATNNGEKVSKEFLHHQERLVLGYLCTTSLILTYITFFIVGF